jgi:hypothetical protein
LLEALTSQTDASRVTSRLREVLLAFLMLLSLLALALEAGFWERTRTFSGPFPTDASRPVC